MHQTVGGLEELTIGAPASRGDIADAAGVLALHRLQVIDARAHTVAGRSVSTWRVTPSFGEPPDPQRLAVDLRRVVAGTLDVKDRLRRRETSFEYAADAPARGWVVADASDRATVVEVRAADSPGLLHRLLRRMESAGARVQAAKVSTLGSDVVDVFYLLNDDGLPLSAAAVEDLRGRLVEAAELPG
jgi:[protein-PII] uridylyltransferase